MMYDVDMHFKETEKQYQHWSTYRVKADCINNARYNAIMRVIKEVSREYAETIDCIRVYKQRTDKLLKEYNI